MKSSLWNLTHASGSVKWYDTIDKQQFPKENTVFHCTLGLGIPLSKQRSDVYFGQPCSGIEVNGSCTSRLPAAKYSGLYTHCNVFQQLITVLQV